MGLDITAFSRIARADNQELDNGEPVAEGGFIIWADDFPERCPELEHRAVYQINGERFDFRAGSYTGYNEWRNQLARLAGYPYVVEDHRGGYDIGVWKTKAPGPFYELIDFADNEGTIGASVSAKLAKDFADFQDKADSATEPYFRELYAKWRRAFELASDSGCVVFH